MNSLKSPRHRAHINDIPSLSSLFPKNTGWTRASRMNSASKRIEGGLFELRLTVKAKELIHPRTRTRFLRCRDGLTPPLGRPPLIYSRGSTASASGNAASSKGSHAFKFFRFSSGTMFFGSQAELFEKFRKSENFFCIDLSNSRDFFNTESLAQHF